MLSSEHSICEAVVAEGNSWNELSANVLVCVVCLSCVHVCDCVDACV